MQLLQLNMLGAREQSTNSIDFGIYLPSIAPAAGFSLSVKIIHEEDQFLQSVPPLKFPLTHRVDPNYGDYWSGTVSISAGQAASPASAWGKQGTYVYRFAIDRNGVEVLDWIIDPFAREFGVGRQAAFTLGYQAHQWDASVEAQWKIPALRDLVVYELMLSEFASGLAAAEAKLPYLRDLGVNCLEIMPVTNVELTVDWGFLPVGYFGVDERFGNRQNFQQFIESCHKNGLAVILDMIYGHTGAYFAYEYVYSRLNIPNPFMGAFAKDMFGCSTNFNVPYVQDYFFTVNCFWIDCFHVDGIRYDCVPNYYDGCAGKGFSNLAYETYRLVQGKKGAPGWSRFFDGDRINLIQCAEQLECPVEILEKTYANCAWQNWTLDAARGAAGGTPSLLTNFGNTLGALGYPDTAKLNQDQLDKCVFQYLENHDHSRFLSCFGVKYLWSNIMCEGKREENWFKIQPYVIGLLLGKGIPMLWQGQEFVEKYDIPNDGYGRVSIHRPVRWELFYDEPGQGMIRLVRKLLTIRNEYDVFRNSEYHFHDNWNLWQSNGLVLFSRWKSDKYVLVALNTTENSLATQFWFPFSGQYRDLLGVSPTLQNVVAYVPAPFQVPSNYGVVWSNF